MSGMKMKATEIECGGLNLKSYIDKKVNNLFQRTFQFMPYMTWARFTDLSAETIETASTWTQLPLVTSTISSDDNTFEIDDYGYICYKGNLQQMLHFQFDMSALLASGLTDVTRLQFRVRRIASDGSTTLSIYKQFQLPLTSTSYSCQFDVHLDYEGGIAKGDKIAIEWTSNKANTTVTWSKLGMFCIVKPVIQNDLLKSSL